MVLIDLPAEAFRPEVIDDALAGRVPQIPPSAALALLADVDIPQLDRPALLRAVLTDMNIRSDIRAGAVNALARMDRLGALTTLTDLVQEPEELLAASAARALGRIGGPDQMPALERLSAASPGELAREQAAFAATLIVHRFGLTDHDVRPPGVDTLPVPVGIGGLPFVSVRAGLTWKTRVLACAHRDLPWVDPAEDQVFELQCGGRLMGIVVSSDLLADTGRRALASRPAVLGVVVFQDVEHDELSPALLALSRPTGSDTVSVLLTELSGAPAFVAEGSSTDYGLDLYLRAVRRPGNAPIAARIRITDGGVDVSGITDRRSEPPSQPQPATGPYER